MKIVLVSSRSLHWSISRKHILTESRCIPCLLFRILWEAAKEFLIENLSSNLVRSRLISATCKYRVLMMSVIFIVKTQVLPPQIMRFLMDFSKVTRNFQILAFWARKVGKWWNVCPKLQRTFRQTHADQERMDT